MSGYFCQIMSSYFRLLHESLGYVRLGQAMSDCQVMLGCVVLGQVSSCCFILFLYRTR
jgi:hypothetical protein